MQVLSVCKGANTKPGALSFFYSSTDRAGMQGAGQPALYIAHDAQASEAKRALIYTKI
jgi:hypothetical protein